MLTQEQTDQIKQKIIEQLENSVPHEKFQELQSYILQLNPQELEEFLKKNKINIQQIDQQENQIEQNQPQQNIFRLIIEGKVPSYKIAENSQALAVLEINPQALGHIIIIPKKHLTKTSELSNQAFSLAKKVAKKLKSVLKTQDVKITAGTIINHAIINVIPIYEEGTKLENGKISNEKLAVLQDKLQIIKKQKLSSNSGKKKSFKKTQEYKLPRRIP